MPRPGRRPQRKVHNSSNDTTCSRKRSKRRLTQPQVHDWLKLHKPLIDTMSSGFILYEVIYDDSGEPVDYVFQYVNPAFERLSGLSASDVLGKGAAQVFASFDRQRWHNLYRHVVLSGESGALVEYHPWMGCFIELSAYRPIDGFVAVTFVDAGDRVQAERGLKDRLRVEHALAEASSLLVSGEEADITEVLGILGRAVSADRAYIFLFRDNYRYMDNTHEWCTPGTPPEIDNLQNCATEAAPWWMDHIRADKAIVVPDVSAMPPEATAEQEVLRMQDIKSLLVVPMCSDGRIIGYLGFDDTIGPRKWSQEEYLLRAASGLITSYFERCKAQDALRKSEIRYRELTDLLPQSIFEVGINGLLTFVNQHALDSFGYTYEEFVKGVNVLQTVIPEQREMAAENMRQVVSSKCNVTGNEYTALRKDGSTFPVIIYSDTIIRDGEVTGIRGVIADISEQKRVEEELRSRTSELEAVVNAFPDLYFWLDSTGIILNYHTTATGDLYVAPEHFLGYKFRDVLPTDVAYELECAAAEASDSRLQTYVEYLLPMFGNEHYYEARFVPLHDDQVLVVVRNITSRKIAEEALRNSEQKFRGIFDSSLDGLVIISEDGRVVDANHAICYLVGLTKEEIIGREILDFVTTVNNPFGLWDDFVQNGVQRGEVVVLSVDGSKRDVEYNAVAHAIHGYHFASLRDISERKQAERDLEFERAQLLSIFDSISEVVYVADPYTHEILYANKTANELFGKNLVGYICYREIEGQQEPCEYCTNPAILAEKGQPYQYEYYNTVLARHYMVTDKIIKWPDGRDVRFELAIDITELKRAEAEMRLQSCAINAASDQIAITDSDGKIEFINPAYSCDYAPYRNGVGEILSIADKHPEIWEQVKQGQIWRGEIVDRDRDVRALVEDATITPVRNITGEIEHFVVIKRDITERKIAERQYSSLVSSIPGVVYRVSFDRSPAVEFVSAGTANLLGWKEEEVAGMSIEEFIEKVVPEDRQAVYDAFFTADAGDSYHLHLRMNARNGEIEHLETMGRLYRGPDGTLETAEGIVFNVTDRVHEQEQLNQARRMETVGKLAAGIAHDFNNLMQGVLGYTRILSENSSLDDSARFDLLEIERVSLRAADLVRQILAFSRQASSKLEPVDMAAIVSEVIQLLKTTSPKNIDIVTVIPARIAPVMADSSQIHEVLINLGLNARDAMPDGGKLTILLEQVTLPKESSRLHHSQPAQFIRCKVTDTGHGMDDDTLKRAYDPFFTTKPLHKGTGLGLSICYGIIESHNGSMHIESELNQGTSVSIFLPMAEVENKQKAIEEPQSTLRGSETILVVDDEEYIRRLTDRLLSSFGYQVLLAENGVQAVDTVASSGAPVDLVLLDLNMPEMSGASAFSTIRRIKPGVKVLVLSGLDAKLEVSPEVARPDAMLQKPCQPEVLLRKIREVLDG